MTELDLYKFIEEWGVETSYDGEKAIVWIDHSVIGDFVKMIGSGLLDEGGIEVRLKETCIALDMNEICEYNDIDIDKVFDKN